MEDMILGDWACVHIYMDNQSIITIASEVLKAGVELMALWLGYRHALAHNILQSTLKTEPPNKEIKDYAWQSEHWEDGTREIPRCNTVTTRRVQKKYGRIDRKTLEAVARCGQVITDNHGAKLLKRVIMVETEKTNCQIMYEPKITHPY